MYDEKLFLEHDNALTENEIASLIELEKRTDEEYAKLNEELKALEKIMDMAVE